MKPIVLVLVLTLVLCLGASPALGQSTGSSERGETSGQAGAGSWLLLSSLGYTAAMSDVGITLHSKSYYESTGGRFREDNPLSRPLVNLPAPAYVAASLGLVTLNNWLALKLKRSDNRVLRRIWWVPQLVQISGNVAGAVYTRRELTRAHIRTQAGIN